jgi:two-component system, chemotaxis family, response regulator Rcp1
VREVDVSDSQYEILMVEDNLADVRLAKEAFKQGKIHDKLNVVRDGVEAMAYLRREEPYADVNRPDIVFLDLNLPRKDGREVLAEIKADPELRRIPIVVLTTSRAEMDIVKSYNLHANCYVVKPVDLDRYIDLIRNVEQFWLAAVTLSPR